MYKAKFYNLTLLLLILDNPLAQTSTHSSDPGEYIDLLRECLDFHPHSPAITSTVTNIRHHSPTPSVEASDNLPILPSLSAKPSTVAPVQPKLFTEVADPHTETESPSGSYI